MNHRFLDKVVLITGGGSGIGRATTILFAEEKAKVIVGDFDRTAGQTTVDDLVSKGIEALFIPVDVAQCSSVKAMVEEILNRFGRLDCLFHSAGIYETGIITDVDEGHWDRIIDVNLKSTFLVLKHVIPAMIKSGGGAIVTAASVAGYAPFPGNPVYSASKAGVIMLTQCIARDFGEFGIRANVICPSPVLGPMMDRSLKNSGDPEADRKFLEDRTLLKRLASPEEIAKLVLFLASDESSYITGDKILIDGGKLTMNK